MRIKKSVYPDEKMVEKFVEFAAANMLKEGDAFDLIVYLAQQLSDEQLTKLKKAYQTNKQLKITVR